MSVATSKADDIYRVRASTYLHMWMTLQSDLREALAAHRRCCKRCDAVRDCDFALGLEEAYDLVEARLSQTREPLL